MRRHGRTIRALSPAEDGQTTVEWALLLACFGLPMIYVLAVLLSALVEHYRMVTFLQTLPYP